jgi:eukaryotic-like serine/threonine-protein kinase
MSSRDWSEVSALAEELLDTPAVQREAEIARRCGTDGEFANAVRQLLSSIASVESKDFLGTPAFAGHPLPEDPIARGLAGTEVGGFVLEQAIGEGGMGVVFAARQRQPERVVAVKVLRPTYATGTAIRRFEVEAEILGRLQHPSIASVIASGIHRFEGGGLSFELPWYAMEHVAGARTIAEYVQDTRPSTAARFELIARVCDAVAHAHSMGVIHRDLKPGNILIDEAGRPKIIDFGIARALGSDGEVVTRHTRTGDLIGTLRYMSPEQLEGDPARTDVRSDVYALGVILFEILTGRAAHAIDGMPITEALRVLRSSDSLSLSKSESSLKGEPEWIVRKATEKVLALRYSSAAALRDDCRRYLTHEALEAGPPSGVYRVTKFVRRHRILVTAVSSILLALAGGLFATQRALDRALAAEAKATDEAVVSNQVMQLFQRVFESAQTENRGKDLKVVDSLSDAAKYTLTDLADRPYLASRLMSRIAGLYYSIGDWNSSTESWERTLELLERSGQGRIEDVLQARVIVADMRQRMGDYAGSLAMLDETEPLVIRALGADHPQRLEIQFQRAARLLNQGRAIEAEPLLRESADARERVLGPNDANTLASWNALNVVLQDQGKFEEAEPIARETFERMLASLGPDDTTTNMSRVNLATLLAETQVGKYEEARDLLLEAMATYERTTGFDHPNAILALTNLGNVRSKLDERDQAISDLETALARSMKVLGPENPSTLQVVISAARLQLRFARNEDAERTLRESIAAARTKLPDDNVALQILHGTHAEALRRLGRIEEARAEMTRAYEVLKAALGADAPQTKVIADNLKKFDPN